MLISYLLQLIFPFFHTFTSIIQSNNDFNRPSIQPFVHPSACPSVCRWEVGEVVLFWWGCCFIKINKWYLCSGVESITNGSWRKGNLGRSALAGKETEWVFTVKYNQCITKHIRGLLKKPSTPHSPPMKIANIIMAYMVRHWKSLSESQGRGFDCSGTQK